MPLEKPRLTIAKDKCRDKEKELIWYVGSVRIVAFQQENRLQLIKQHMEQFRAYDTAVPVLLTISITGIKVCSPDGSVVHMAHALRRISYATCDLNYNQFCYLAREPKGHYSSQYCHLFSAKTPQLAEELNSIVGNAFQMAYATQAKGDTAEKHENAFSSPPNATAQQDGADSVWKSKHPNRPYRLSGLDSMDDFDNRSTESSPSSSEDSNSPSKVNYYTRLINDKPQRFWDKSWSTMKCGKAVEEDGYPFVRPTPEGCISCQKDALPDWNRESYRCSDETSTGCEIPSRHYPLPPPLPPDRENLLKQEQNELKSAPWFQAGIPREITLEVLSQEPVGSFMVRESTTKRGCFALSLRVPKENHPRGIAHYLIIKTNKGYKIKGFTKEFTTLTSLITHHSVMQELLPCPLSLSRYNPVVKHDTSRDFADMDSDSDYNTISDFRRMMASLKM